MYLSFSISQIGEMSVFFISMTLKSQESSKTWFYSNTLKFQFISYKLKRTIPSSKSLKAITVMLKTCKLNRC